MILSRLLIPLCLMLATCFTGGVLSADAQELQITDYLGLIRAQRTIHDKVSVRITVLSNPRTAAKGSENKPLLTQRTGFSSDIEAVEIRKNAYVFNGVTAGFWRIRLRNNALLLDGVEILDNADPAKNTAPAAVGGVAPKSVPPGGAQD